MIEPQNSDPALHGRWDTSVLDPMAEINEEVLAALLGAAGPAVAEPAAGSLAGHWQALGAPARRRLARCPYLLVDAGFARAQLWQQLPRAGVSEMLWRPQVPLRVAPLDTPLLRRVLVFAWHLARANRLAARIALGMTGACAKALATSRLADLELLAEQRPAWIRPRWEARPQLWAAWVSAAADKDPAALERLQLWGLQMLAAEALDTPP